MFLKRVAFVGAVAMLPAFAQVSSAPAQMTEKIARHQHGPIKDRHDHGDGTSDSTNWSGYAVTGSSFTSAEASWVVPTATCKGDTKDEYAAFWVGLDGFNDSTVEQTGTDSDCDRTSPSYYAWYEFYPKASYEITSVPVAPGDVMYAQVVYSGSEFTITITNKTTGKSYSKSSTVSGAARSSAEWIAEAPSNGVSILPMSDFGTILFGYDSSAVSGTNDATDSTTSGDIGSFPSADINQIDKVGKGKSPQTSTCTALSSDGTSFSCKWGS